MEKKNITELLSQIGIKPIDRQENHVLVWKQFYEGFVKDFHEYREYQGDAHVTRNRKSMHMAKVIAELWSDNIINPETNFFAGKVQEWLDAYIDIHDVKNNLNEFYEPVFALGLGSTVQYRNAEGRAINQYVIYDNIYPFEVINREVTGCAFVSESTDYLFIQIHQKQGALWVIQNLYFTHGGELIPNEEINNGAVETFVSQQKLFQIHQPSIANNINIGNPLGISIYANAIEELRSVDIAYDALDKEIRNGRMRVYVQGEALIYDKGEQRPIFNKDQDEFYLLPADATNPDGTLIKVEAPTLRVEQLIENLKLQLNLLGSKCGLGDNAFYSDRGGIYTNTEQVVSSNSKFYKTRTKHTTGFHTPLVEMIKALYYLEHNKILNENVYVEFDDSIIHDKNTEYQRTMQLFNAGLIDRVEVYMQLYKMSEQEAIEFNNKMTSRMNLTDDLDDE